MHVKNAAKRTFRLDASGGGGHRAAARGYKRVVA